MLNKKAAIKINKLFEQFSLSEKEELSLQRIFDMNTKSFKDSTARNIVKDIMKTAEVAKFESKDKLNSFINISEYWINKAEHLEKMASPDYASAIELINKVAESLDAKDYSQIADRLDDAVLDFINKGIND